MTSGSKFTAAIRKATRVSIVGVLVIVSQVCQRFASLGRDNVASGEPSRGQLGVHLDHSAARLFNDSGSRGYLRLEDSDCLEALLVWVCEYLQVASFGEQLVS